MPGLRAMVGTVTVRPFYRQVVYLHNGRAGFAGPPARSHVVPKRSAHGELSRCNILGRVLPFTATDSDDPEDLWEALEAPLGPPCRADMDRRLPGACLSDLDGARRIGTRPGDVRRATALCDLGRDRRELGVSGTKAARGGCLAVPATMFLPGPSEPGRRRRGRGLRTSGFSGPRRRCGASGAGCASRPVSS